MADLELRRYANTSPETSLASGINATDTSLTVVAGTGFPDVNFTIRINSEIIFVGTRTGNTFSGLKRAYDTSLPAATHSASDAVLHVLTSDDFDHRVQDVIHTRPYGQFDDEFDDSTDSLAKVSIGTATWQEGYGVQSVVFSGQSANDVSGNVYSIGTMGIGGGVQAGVRILAVNDQASAGVLFSSGGTTTDSAVWQYITSAPDSGTMNIGLRSGTFTNLSTSHLSDQFNVNLVDRIHMRLIWVGVNQFRAWWSIDGLSWTAFGYGPHTVTGINPPTRFGMGVSAWGTTGDKLATFDYLRIWEP